MAIEPDMYKSILFRLFLTVYFVAFASALHAGWRAKRFEVSDLKSGTIVDDSITGTIARLESLQLKQKEDNKERNVEVVNTTVKLKLLGSMTAGTNPHVSDDYSAMSFTPRDDKGSDEWHIEREGLNLCRIPLLEKPPEDSGFEWIIDDSITPTWKLFSSTSIKKGTVKSCFPFFRRSNSTRRRKSASYSASKPSPFGRTSSVRVNNVSGDVDQKPTPLHSLRLGVITEKVVSLAEKHQQEELFSILSEFVDVEKENWRGNVIIDGLPGLPVDKINILLLYGQNLVTPEKGTASEAASLEDRKYTFLGFEYTYTPPSPGATAIPEKMQVRWDIHSDRVNLLAAPAPTSAHQRQKKRSDLLQRKLELEHRLQFLRQNVEYYDKAEQQLVNPQLRMFRRELITRIKPE